MNQYKKPSISIQIKEKAKSLNFLDCGISEAEQLQTEAKYLSEWLEQNKNGTMDYMANHFEKRTNPEKLFEGTKSVISLTYNYYIDEMHPDADEYKISKYAYGEDYHIVIKKILREFESFLKELMPEVNCRSFVDSAPVMDKVWAVRSGLGWMGKNTNVISKKHGSFFFLAEILIDQELEYDIPVKDCCGKCTRCIDACPTNAIYQPYKLDASKCISYLTIELKKEIPDEFRGSYKNWIFGCDICQDVCPWNSKSILHNEPAFYPQTELKQMTKSDWENLSEDKFNGLFRKSAIKRTKYQGLKRNIRFLND